MQLAFAIVLMLLCQNAASLQTNAINIRQQEENRDHHVCGTLSSTSVAAKEVCAVLSEQTAAADFQAYRDLLADDSALNDFRSFTKLRANPKVMEHLHRMLADPTLLEKFTQFQQFQQWQETQVSMPHSRQAAVQIASRETLQDEQQHVSDSMLFVIIPLVLLVIFCSVMGCGAACGNLVAACFTGLQVMYMLALGPDSLDDDRPPKKEPSLDELEKLGIAKPVKTLWYTEWEDLTAGQRWVFSYIGVTDKTLWDIARKMDNLTKEDHDVRDQTLSLEWKKLTQRQKGKLNYLGFTEASFNEDAVTPMGMHEKRWEDLSKMEKKAVAKLLGVNPKSDECPEWDHRQASIFHTRFHMLPHEQRQELVKLGFGLRHWKPYVDPEVPVRKEMSWCEYCMDKCGKALVGFIGLFFLCWLLYCIHETGVMHNIFANIGTYAFGVAVVFIVVAIIVYEVWEIANYVLEAFVLQVKTILNHVKEVWELVNDSIERVEDKLGKLDVKTKVVACATTTCVPNRG